MLVLVNFEVCDEYLGLRLCYDALAAGVQHQHDRTGRFVPSHYLSFARRALFFLLPFLRFPSPPPQFSAHAALQVRHLPESHAATQSQQLGQTHAVHCRGETQGSTRHFSALS